MIPTNNPIVLQEATRLAKEWWQRGTPLPVEAFAALLVSFSRPETRDLWVRRVAAGEKCPKCLGIGYLAPVDAAMCDCGDGYVLARDNLRPLLDVLHGGLLPEQAAVCIEWSVESWLAGGLPLRGVASEWKEAIPGRGIFHRSRVTGSPVDVGYRTTPHPECDEPGWWFADTQGSETGTVGRDMANAAAHAGYYALLEDGQAVLPPLAARREP